MGKSSKRGRVIDHLQGRGCCKGKSKEGRGCRVKSPSLSLSSVLTVTRVATDQSAGPHFSTAWAALHQIVPPFRRGPLETFVPFISTTNTYRCSMKEDADAQRVFRAHASPAKRAPIPETSCSFVNKRHSEELMRGVVSLNMDSSVF